MISDAIAKLVADYPQYALILAVAVLGPADFIFGALRAYANSTFKLSLLDVWVRTQLAGRIVPILLALIIGSFFPAIPLLGFQLNLITTGADIAAVAYLAVTAKSIVDSLNPRAPDELPKE